MFLITRNYLQIAPRIYPLYPICFIGSIFGSLCLVDFCYIISNKKALDKISSGCSLFGKEINANSVYPLFRYFLAATLV